MAGQLSSSRLTGHPHHSPTQMRIITPSPSRKPQPRSERVRMLRTCEVSQDGWDNDTFFKGELYSVTPRLCAVLLGGGIAIVAPKRRGRKPADSRIRKVRRPSENKAAH